MWYTGQSLTVRGSHTLVLKVWPMVVLSYKQWASFSSSRSSLAVTNFTIVMMLLMVMWWIVL